MKSSVIVIPRAPLERFRTELIPAQPVPVQTGAMSRRNHNPLPDWREMVSHCIELGRHVLTENPNGMRTDLLAHCADLIVYVTEARRIEKQLRRRAEGRAPAIRR